MPTHFIGLLLLGSQLVPLRLHIVQSEAQEDSCTLQLPVREVLLPHLFVVEVLDGEVGQQSAVGELVTLEVDEGEVVVVMHVVVAPVLAPGLGLEGDWEGASHLDCPADRQVGGCFVVEEAEYFVVEVD